MRAFILPIVRIHSTYISFTYQSERVHLYNWLLPLRPLTRFTTHSFSPTSPSYSKSSKSLVILRTKERFGVSKAGFDAFVRYSTFIQVPLAELYKSGSEEWWVDCSFNEMRTSETLLLEIFGLSVNRA